jgi:hypothetical protein
LPFKDAKRKWRAVAYILKKGKAVRKLVETD